MKERLCAASCLRACTLRNPYNGAYYLAAAIPSGVILFQWYEPLAKFLIIKVPLSYHCHSIGQSRRQAGVAASRLQHSTPSQCLRVVRDPRVGLPYCLHRRPQGVGVSPLEGSGSGEGLCSGDRKHVVYDTVRLGGEGRRDSGERNAAFPRIHDVAAIRQLDKDAVVVAYNGHSLLPPPSPALPCPCSYPGADKAQLTSLRGQLKSSKVAAAELRFPFRIDALLPLSDSLLAFHRHGLMGKSLIDGEATQELGDTSRTYRLLGADKLPLTHPLHHQPSLVASPWPRSVVVESKKEGEEGVDLLVLTGHESTF